MTVKDADITVKTKGAKKATRAHKRAAKKAHRATKKVEKKAKKVQNKIHKESKRAAKKAKSLAKKPTKKSTFSEVKKRIRIPKLDKVAEVKKIGYANLLTLLRIVCIPIFITLFALEYYLPALITFGIAGLTDLVDGTVARLRKENSKLGAVLDPIADKGLMLATFISLAVKGVISWWFIYIILTRDFVVMLGFVYVKIKGFSYEYKAILSSKIATLFEIVAGTLALIYVTFPYATIGVYPLIDITYGAVLVASVLILIATLQYIKVGIDLLEKDPKKAASHG